MSQARRISKRKTKGQNKYLESLLQEERDSLTSNNNNNDDNNNATTTDTPTHQDTGNTKISRDYTVYCSVCNTTDDNYDESTDPFGDMIQCDRCDTWQHINCILQNQSDPIESFFHSDGKYICNLCEPQRYPHLASSIKGSDTTTAFTTTTKDDDDGDYNDNNYTFTNDNDGNDLDILDEVYDSDTKVKKSRKKRKSMSTDISAPAKKKNGNKKTTDTSPPPQQPAAIVDKSQRIRDNASKMFIDLFTKFIIPDTIKENEYSLPTEKTIIEIGQEMGRSLEMNLFKYVNEDKPIMINPKLYSEKVRIIYSNVKDVKNLKLKSHIINGKLSLYDLVRLNTTQLMNPDLQSFKKSIDSRIMDQVVFEAPSEKPLYVKTHKGEELIERDSDINNGEGNNINNNNNNNGGENNINLESDFLIRDNIGTIHHNDGDKDNDTKPLNPKTTEASTTTTTTIPIKNTNHFSQRVNIKLQDILPSSSSLINNAIYLSCSNNQLRNPYKECLLDGNLTVEGRLTTLKAYKYLNDIKSSRNILAYYLKDYSINNYTEIVDWMLLNDKILGLTCRKHYIKTVYLIASDSGEYPTIINDLFPQKEISEIVTYSEPKLFLLVVVKPELIK